MLHPCTHAGDQMEFLALGFSLSLCQAPQCGSLGNEAIGKRSLSPCGIEKWTWKILLKGRGDVLMIFMNLLLFLLRGRQTRVASEICQSPKRQMHVFSDLWQLISRTQKNVIFIRKINILKFNYCLQSVCILLSNRISNFFAFFFLVAMPWYFCLLEF